MLFLLLQIPGVKAGAQRCSRRNHGKNFIVTVDLTIDQHSGIQLKRLFHRRCKLLFAGHTDAHSAHGFRHFHIIGFILQDGVGIPLSVEQRLPLTDHAEHMVVDHQLNQRKLIAHRRLPPR